MWGLQGRILCDTIMIKRCMHYPMKLRVKHKRKLKTALNALTKTNKVIKKQTITNILSYQY